MTEEPNTFPDIPEDIILNDEEIYLLKLEKKRCEIDMMNIITSFQNRTHLIVTGVEIKFYEYNGSRFTGNVRIITDL